MTLVTRGGRGSTFGFVCNGDRHQMKVLLALVFYDNWVNDIKAHNNNKQYDRISSNSRWSMFSYIFILVGFEIENGNRLTVATINRYDSIKCVSIYHFYTKLIVIWLFGPRYLYEIYQQQSFYCGAVLRTVYIGNNKKI